MTSRDLPSPLCTSLLLPGPPLLSWDKLGRNAGQAGAVGKRGATGALHSRRLNEQGFGVMKSAEIWVNPSARYTVVAVKRADTWASEASLLQPEGPVPGFKSPFD